MEGTTQAAEQRDWLALPAGILQHIFLRASTWQAPGSCLGASVCRAWRSAAAGCRGVRLLYHAGHVPADLSCVAWLCQNSHQLGSLTLTGSNSSCSVQTGLILTALALAAAEAQAAGRPLRLHTLRVLEGQVRADILIELLTSLPALRHLQMGTVVPTSPYSRLAGGAHAALAMQQMGRLLCATQLEELHLKGVNHLMQTRSGMSFGVLPPNLKRLSWDLDRDLKVDGDLSHMTQLTFLRMNYWETDSITSSTLPADLQQLHLGLIRWRQEEVLQAELPLVTGWTCFSLMDECERQLFTRLTNLKVCSVDVEDLCDPDVPAALTQLRSMSSLTVTSVYNEPEDEGRGMHMAIRTAASMGSLRRLHLDLDGLLKQVRPADLAALTQLTQLRVSDARPAGTKGQRLRLWARTLGSMSGLQWLSAPHVLLTAVPGWLGGLQQLRVLMLQWAGEAATDVGAMPWLDAGSWQGLCRQLQVLGVSGMTAQQAAGWELRRRLQQLVCSSGCEVVVGVSLDEVADPIQQLAGLPVALQQALA